MPETNIEIVKKVNDAFSENKPEVFLSYCADDVEWEIAGDREFKGVDAIREFMASMEGMEPPKFTVDEIIDGGESIACCGDMTMKDEKGETGDYSYCDVYRFNNGKIARLQSFVVKHKSEDEATGKAA